MNRKQLLNILKVIVSIGLLIFIFNTINIQAFAAVIGRANPWWLLAAMAIMILGVFIRAFRWQILLNAINVPVPLAELTAIYFIGFLFNNLLPSGLGGDAMRMYELNRYSQRGSDAVTSVLVDRFLGLSSLQLLAIIALIFSWGAIPAAVAYFTVVIFTAMLIAGFLLINRPLFMWLREKISLFRKLSDISLVGKLFESFQSYPLPALGRSYLVAIIFNATLILMNLCIGNGLGAEATLAQYAVFVPITSLVLVIPISFAGLGVREEAYRQLFGQVGVPGEVAVAISLMVYAIGNIFTGLIGGVIYLIRSARDVVSEKGKIN